MIDRFGRIFVERNSQNVDTPLVDMHLVVGDPPCQSFSRAGRNKIRSLVEKGIRPETDHRTDLWKSFVQIVAAVRPNAVLMENVPDLAFGIYTPILRQIVSELEDAGYEVQARILSSADFGIPQHRNRLFIVGVKEGFKFAWPEPEQIRINLRDAISDLPNIHGGDVTNPRQYGMPESAFQSELRKDVPDSEQNLIFDHVARRVREDDLQIYQLMDSKTQYDELLDNLKRYRDDIFGDKYNRLDWDRPSRTITAHISKDGYWYIHPEQHRTLTMREAARIQTFPDQFRFSGFQTGAFRQIGEAVPPHLARSIVSSLMRSLGESTDVHVQAADWNMRLSPPSSRELSEVLGKWVDSVDVDTLVAPWRLSGDLWHVLLGMIVFDTLNQPTARRFWNTYARRWPEPQDFSSDDQGKMALVALGQGSLYEQVRDLVGILGNNRNDWPTEFPATIVPAVNGIQARMLCDLGTEFPASIGAVRTAARIHGTEIQEPDMHGRLALARALGAHCNGSAYGALLEIGDQFCTASGAHCQVCPLNSVCVTGRQTLELEPSPATK